MAPVTPVYPPSADAACSTAGPCPVAAVSLRDDAGASSVGSLFGVAIFLGFLLVSSQTLIHLYAASTITAVAFDTARRASGAGGDCATSRADAITRLGAWGADPGVEVLCRVDAIDGRTEVVISGPSPARGLSVFGRGVVDRIERGASFRTEGLDLGSGP